MLEIVKQGRHAVLDKVIDHEEIQTENKHGDDHYRGGGAYFFPGGRRDLAHLRAHVVVESPNALGPRLNSVAKVAS